MATVALSVYRSSIGKKAVMAVTGIALYGFVVAHMLGNLKLFQGREHFNEYAEGLRTLGAPILPREAALWGLRAVLLVAVVLHSYAAWQTTRMSRGARPVGYTRKKRVQASLPSLTMRWGGVALALFIVYHLLHMTTGQAHEDFVHGDPYHNMVTAFSHWYLVAVYAIAVFALAMHVYHGAWSLFQTLGRGSGRYKDAVRTLASVSAVALFVGYLAGPVAVAVRLVD